MTHTNPSRRQVLRAGGIATAVLAGCVSSGTNDTVGFTDGFEEEITGWEKGADVPEDPNNPGNPVDWRIERSTERAASGSASLRYYLDGRQDDGTIWVVRPVAVESGQSYDVTMRTDAWSASESFNTIAHLVMSAGPNPPKSEGSFPDPGTRSSGETVSETGGLREPLNQAEGWEPYAFAWRTPTLDTGQIYIAVGISAVWETEMTYFVDDVELSATPR